MVKCGVSKDHNRWVGNCSLLLILFFLVATVSAVPAWGVRIRSMRAKGRIISRGTTKGEVLRWLGKPNRVEVIAEGVADYDRREVWYYEGQLSTHLIYFSGPKVYRIEMRR